MSEGDFHGSMKEYMDKTCPDNSWDAFEHELDKYRDLSKALKLCRYYSEQLDLKTQELSDGKKDLKVLAIGTKKWFSEISAKERVEFSFQRWMTAAEGVRQRSKGVCERA
jgi:hypothetical protein